MNKLFLGLCFSWLSLFAFSQEQLTVESYLGYEVGTTFTFHHEIVGYFQHVAANSEMVNYISYGKSNEGRDLGVAVISSPENLKNLDQLLKNNRINTGLEKGQIQGNNLAICWLSYNIHGDEASGAEAALSTLEALATQKKYQNWIDNLIIVLDPCENPDGRDRYAQWYRQVASIPHNASRASIEHSPPWPGGRVNHYLFDLNRDWAWQTQIESQQRLKLYHRFMPHVHVDLHEMGYNQPYFFAPAAEPFHKDITEWQYDFQVLVGDNNAKYFDKKGWAYYTTEVFDLFYPSYGDTWPIFNGAIGFTYEQGGSRNAGTCVVRETGDTLTLKERVEHHFTTSISTIETTYTNREKLLREFKIYFDENQKGIGEYQAYVIKQSNDPDRIKAILDLLDKQRIQYGKSTISKSINGFDYNANKEQSRAIEKGDIVVPSAQPQSRLLKVLFEPNAELSDSITYDLTAWALPFAYGLDAIASKEKIAHKSFTLSKQKYDYSGPSRAYAYLAKWGDANDARFLSALINEGIKVRFAEKPFQSGGTTYARGTLIINRSDNANLKGRFDEMVQATAKRESRNLTAIFTGKSEKGMDIGSDAVRYIKPPKIALISGDGVNPNAFGEVWHYFEQVLGYPVTILHSSYIRRIDFSNYDVIVVTSGSYGEMNIRSKLTNFASEGGKIIAIGSGMSLFSSGSTKLAAALKGKEDSGGKDDPLMRYEDRERASISEGIEGAVYQVSLDDSHPLAFGEDGTMHLIKRNSRVYPYLQSGWNIGTFKRDAHVSGFVGSQIKSKIPNSLAIGVENYGSGKIVYFTDSPIFRGFWHSGKLVLANAVFFVGN